MIVIENNITCYKELKMARHDPQMNVRLPESLLAEVKREASNQRRTMTAQINLIIEEWLDSKKQQDAKA